LVLATVSAARRSTSTLGVISSGSWFWVARKENDMIGVVVTFRFGDNFDEQAVRKIADTARARFEGMPGLRSKAFTFNSAKREAANFYVWDSEDAAKAFFTDQLLERVTGLYGVRPTVEFVQIATLVENTRT
jgi:heme-degrading monooxygenase HmoA